MQVEVTHLQPRDEREMVLVTLHGSKEEGPINHSFDVRVFVPQSDSYSGIRAAAITKAQELMREFLINKGSTEADTQGAS